jgi:hypothetical protein
MTDYLTELNRIMDHLATMPDVVATALTGNVDEFLILSDERTRYTERDDWAALFRISLEPPRSRGTLIERRAMLAGAPVTFLFGGPKWAGTDPIAPDTAKMLADGVFEIHDPRGLIEELNRQGGAHHADFADNGEIAEYRDISSDFFRLVGLGQAVFISNESTLSDWCNASGLSLEHANARIREIYGVDVADLGGGRLIDIFERIRQGDYYRSWRASRE